MSFRSMCLIHRIIADHHNKLFQLDFHLNILFQSDDKPYSKRIGVVMKKINELMKDLGFNPNGSDAVKEAFIKNLMKASYGVNIATPTEKKLIAASPEKIIQFPQQMTFDFIDNDYSSPEAFRKNS